MTARGLFQNSRILCTQHQDNTRITDQKWKTVFRFPFISQAAAINKLKIYQAGFTILFVPLTYLAEANTIIPESSFLVALAIGKHLSCI